PPAELPGRDDVADPVADVPRTFEHQTELGGGPPEERGSGFPAWARTGELRVVWTVVDAIETGAFRRELAHQLALHGGIIVLAIHPARDTGLVRDHDDGGVLLAHAPYRRRRAGEQAELAGVGQVSSLLY